MEFVKFEMPVPGKDHTRPAIKEVGTDEVVCLCTVSYTHLDVYKRQIAAKPQRVRFWLITT